MKLRQNIVGKNILLRSALQTDAEFILEIRLDPALNKWIHPTDPSLESQQDWIRGRLESENDYHLIIEDLTNQKLGTIAIYDIDFAARTFEWGRWIIKKKAPWYTAIESVFLMYDFAFNTLRLERAMCGAQNMNTSVISFHKWTGASISQSNERETWFVFTKDDFRKFRMSVLGTVL